MMMAKVTGMGNTPTRLTMRTTLWNSIPVSLPGLHVDKCCAGTCLRVWRYKKIMYYSYFLLYATEKRKPFQPSHKSKLGFSTEIMLTHLLAKRRRLVWMLFPVEKSWSAECNERSHIIPPVSPHTCSSGVKRVSVRSLTVEVTNFSNTKVQPHGPQRRMLFGKQILFKFQLCVEWVLQLSGFSASWPLISIKTDWYIKLLFYSVPVGSWLGGAGVH